MTNQTFFELAMFIRKQGNVSPLSIEEGNDFAYWKRHDDTDGAKRPTGPPRNHIRIDAGARKDAVTRLGVMNFMTRDGQHFILDARLAATLPGGYEVLQISGLRAGLWNLHREHRFVTRVTDRTLVFAGSVEGVRLKVVRILQASIDELTKPGASLRVRGVARLTARSSDLHHFPSRNSPNLPDTRSAQ